MKIIVVIHFLFGLAGCNSFAENAVSYSGSNGLLAVRKPSKSPIVLMFYGRNDFNEINKKFELHSGDQVRLSSVDLISSRLLLNKGDVSGQPCRWGPVKVGRWPKGTIEYNFEDFSIWTNDKEKIIGIRIMLEGLSKWKDKSLSIDGNRIDSLEIDDLMMLIGDDVKEKAYFSEF